MLRGVYGYWIPAIGTCIINNKISERVTGVGSTSVVAFGGTGPSSLGMSMNGAANGDKDYKNALKLINNLKNRGESHCLSGVHLLDRPGEKTITALACINLRQNEYNFTTNPTILKDNNTGLIDNFNGSMTFDANGSYQQFPANPTRPPNPPSSPTTFITQVDLYDTFGTRVATAKLSKPIKKDFNSEVRIKIMISDY